ncbi:gluconate 2-dehydrogenase subunit 3 family protein [Reichenbachiella sp. MALMAid0571]|uniref:gluconate 2-dehydrogenase subunit 3 family protein n=1 Tax=Reichenbachiella sp. MALMAid0571 TaxID=3143939 RepID=UPI0032DED189
MDRRDSLKSLLVGSLAGGLLINGCTPAEEVVSTTPEKAGEEKHYGRTPKEKKRDTDLMSDKFFSEHELATVAVLCDIILPANDEFGSATDAGVHEFIEFMSKDMPRHQLPLRGGLMWLDNRSNNKFGLEFKSCTDDQQKSLLDEIAYPDKAAPEVQQGVKFFSLMRDLTLSGYYTTQEGFKDLGYKGNTPNVWDGVPQDVLDKHGMKYEEEWLAKCLDPETRNEIAQWDDDGNLLT